LLIMVTIIFLMMGVRIKLSIQIIKKNSLH